MRQLLTIAHREMTIAEAHAVCVQKFGQERTPSKSAIQRYWAVLDRGRRRARNC